MTEITTLLPAIYACIALFAVCFALTKVLHYWMLDKSLFVEKERFDTLSMMCEALLRDPDVAPETKSVIAACLGKGLACRQFMAMCPGCPHM